MGQNRIGAAFSPVGAQKIYDARYLQLLNNLSDVNNVATSVSNLGLTNAVTSFINDTNVTASIVGHVATLGFTGTLAAGRLNSNVVQSVINDTNITGSIAAQALTLGWSGQLGLTRGGTAASLVANNGGILYSTASALAILSGNATAGLSLISGASTTPSWFTPTAGSVIFAGTGGALTQNNSNLFWDNTNLRLGIGISPSFAIDVSSAGSTIGRYTSTLTANDNFFRIDSTASNSTSGFFLTNSNAGINLGAGMAMNGDGSIKFTTNNTATQGPYGANTKLTILRGGNLGIMTTNPGTELHVKQQGNGFGNGLRLEIAGGGTNYWGFVVGGDAKLYCGYQGSTQFLIDTVGRWSFGNFGASSKVHLPAGDTGVSNSPLKFTSGALNTLAEFGAVEYNGNLYHTNAGVIRFSIGGTLFDHYADANSTSTNGTFDDLYSDTLAANTFNGNGDKVTATYGGIFVASATATRNIRVLFAGTIILDTGALTTATADSWYVTVTIIRESATVVRCQTAIVASTTLGAQAFNDTTYTRITGLTLSGTNILKISGAAAGAGAAASDIVGKLGTILFQPAA